MSDDHSLVFASFVFLTSPLLVPSGDNDKNTQDDVHYDLTVVGSSQTICRNEESPNSWQDPLGTKERGKQTMTKKTWRAVFLEFIY